MLWVHYLLPFTFYSKSRKLKNSRKNQCFCTIGHPTARIDAILKKIILTFKAPSVRTHFRGGVMGSNADFMEIGVKPQKYAYPRSPTHPCWTKNGSETSIDPTILHHILHALFFYRKTLIPSPLGAQGGLKNPILLKSDFYAWWLAIMSQRNDRHLHVPLIDAAYDTPLA